MQPTLNPSASAASKSYTRDWVLVWKLSSSASSSSSSLPPGSIVLLKSPYEEKRRMIKRLVGTEGDWITKRRRADTADDADSDADSDADELLLIPRGRIWVEGENAAVSVEDSIAYDRDYGTMLPAGLLCGRVVAVVWPLSRIQWLDKTLMHVGGEQRVRKRYGPHSMPINR